MDFENLFAELEKITETKSKKIVCCNNVENHKNTNGVIECSQCSKIISNKNEMSKIISLSAKSKIRI